MRAYLRSVRMAPKKLNLIAAMVRGKDVTKALVVLSHLHKKAARVLEGVLQSALANAQHNDHQKPGDLFIRSLIVNQASAYRRGVPMARGRVRPIRKFLSHVEVELGVVKDATERESTNSSHSSLSSSSSSSS